MVLQIDVLPDDVLLEIFGFYMITHPDPFFPEREKAEIEAWQSLIHVCRRWRRLVLASPRHLNLQLYCTPETPVKGMLDVWPALPLIVTGVVALSSDAGRDNVIAALGQSNRICRVDLELAGYQVEEVLAPIQVPFPELTDLRLMSFDSEPVIPDSFLDGSAPRLRSLELNGISFPGLPNLLLSTNRLVNLRLVNIPRSGYISPEAMATLLSMFSSLRILFLECKFGPDRESPSLPLQKRSILPALDKFHFEGVSEYLEELVTFIDAPQLDEMRIKFFFQMDLDCPRLAQFINRTPTLSARDKAYVQLDNRGIKVALLARSRALEILIPSIPDPSHRLSFIERVCNSSLHPLSTVEDLHIDCEYLDPIWHNPAVEKAVWLQLLLPFTTVKNLSLSWRSAPGVGAALQGLVGGSRITEVLPSLQNFFFFFFFFLDSINVHFRACCPM